jgi:uridine monophosphate synthetase
MSPTNFSFMEKLSGAIARNSSLLCIGLDPTHLPAPVDRAALTAWGRRLIEQTTDLACCYKPNIAFYEQYGLAGLEALRETIAAVPPDIPVLLDAKRGDIGHTAAAYARAAFEVWGADAVTVSPYLGRDGIDPFVAFAGKAVFVLCYTSNPSAKAIQEFGDGTGWPLFEQIALEAQSWGGPAQLGFVVGATQPDALARVRALAPQHWILAPGVGAQGGDLQATLRAGLAADGKGLLLPVSRSVIYADDPRAAALALRDEVNQYLASTPPHADLMRELYEMGCIQFGDFRLASGKQSPIYIDLRRISSRPLLLQLAADAYAGLLAPLAYDQLAAVPYAALTLGTAVALTTGSPLIYPRKEVKEYGTGKTIEGVFKAGQRAVIIEDLITSGGSILKAIEALEAADLIVSDVVVLIDREQGGRELLAAKGYRLHAALKLSEILAHLRHAGRISAKAFEKVTALT